MSVMVGRLVFVASAFVGSACGRFGFDDSGRSGDAGAGDASDAASDASDRHLHTADGWSISPLFELTGLVPYDAMDFMDGDDVRANDPSYVAALYTPFAADFAVIAGRSVIEVTVGGVGTAYTYRPTGANKAGPDAPGRLTFADFGSGNVGLWMTSGSSDGGDGLFLIDREWHLALVNADNNSYPIALDPRGGFDGQGVATLYVGSQDTLARRTGAGSAPVTGLSWPPGVDELAVVGDALYMTVDNDVQVVLDRIDAGHHITQLTAQPSLNLTLAEGSTDTGLFAIHDNSELVMISLTDGTFTRRAWTDDTGWAWRAVCVPRGGHRLAGKLIVLESNRMLDRDRLLLITPQP